MSTIYLQYTHSVHIILLKKTTAHMSNKMEGQRLHNTYSEVRVRAHCSQIEFCNVL